MSNNWYVSSVAYAAVAQFATSHAYTVGNLIRALAAPANGSKNVYRCTTAGTSGSSEPSWSQSNNGTTTTGGATFTTVGGQSAYGWSAAAGDLYTVTNAAATTGFAAAGDTIFASSDHSESISSPTYFHFTTGTWNATTFLISVNRGGSAPPVEGDVTSGASFTASSGNMIIDPVTPYYIDGCVFATTAGSIELSNNFFKGAYLKNCALQLNGNNSGYNIQNNSLYVKWTWDNTTVQFANSGQGINNSGYWLDLTWINTPFAVQGATIPTNLFKQETGNHGGPLITCRGVDLSAVNTTLVQASTSYVGIKALFDSCKISSSATILGSSISAPGDLVELVNCYDGSNTRNEVYSVGGKVTTERVITLSGGAADDIGSYSLKYVSNATGLDRWATPLEGFSLDTEWSGALGSSKTATVQIVSSSTLNNDDISLELQYQGTSGSSVVSFASSLPVTPVTANSAITTSSATWNSAPSSPVYQEIQVTFIPRVAGRVRGKIKLGKISTTVYIDPVMTIT